MALMDFIKRVTGIETYDASDSEVIVANHPVQCLEVF